MIRPSPSIRADWYCSLRLRHLRASTDLMSYADTGVPTLRDVFRSVQRAPLDRHLDLHVTYDATNSGVGSYSDLPHDWDGGPPTDQPPFQYTLIKAVSDFLLFTPARTAPGTRCFSVR